MLDCELPALSYLPEKDVRPLKMTFFLYFRHDTLIISINDNRILLYIYQDEAAYISRSVNKACKSVTMCYHTYLISRIKRKCFSSGRSQEIEL